MVEALLFLENEPLDVPRICALSRLDEGQAGEALKELSERLFESGSGLDLVCTDGMWEFVPAADLNDDLRRVYGKKVDRRLSKAAIETLAIVAYGQPVTRREIDNIRGVVSDTIVRLLRERDYIKIVGRRDVPGHPCLYGTTRKFLMEFDLASIGDLPKMDEIDRQRFQGDGA